MSQSFIPPQNIEAERAVLGGILLDSKSLLDLPAELKPECFYLPSHQQIFKAILTLQDRGEPVDLVSIFTVLKQLGTTETETIRELADWGMPRSIEYHAKLVVDTYQQRRAIDLVAEALRKLKETPARQDEIIAELYSATDDSLNSGSVHIDAVMVESLKRLEKTNAAQLIPTGFDALDCGIGGMERGDLLVIAGRPSMGKTSLAVDIVLNAARRGYRALIVSVETVRAKLGMRMLSRETKINSRNFRTGSFEDKDLARLVDASGKLSELPIHILDRETKWPNIKREIRQRKRGGLDLVVLDYLTLLDLAAGKNERRDVAVGRIANEAKQLALSLDIVFILLSQLNRKTEDRMDPEPVMSDLKDSGDIEQAADLILFPFRPVVYHPDFTPGDKAFLKVAKARDLPTGKIAVRFNAEITSFSDWTDP